MYKEKILYLIACTLFELPLLIFIYLAVKSKKQETKGHLLWLCMEGLALLPINILFTVTAYTRNALFLKILYYLVRDCLDMTMMTFTAHYCNVSRRKAQLLTTITGTLLSIDVILCVLNFFFPWGFVLERVNSEFHNHQHIFYWRVFYKKTFLLHFFLSGIPSVVTIFNLLNSIFKKSVLYRRKYTGVLIPYLITMLMNYASFTLGINFDMIPFIISFMVIYIVSYTLYIVPTNFIIASLQKYYESEKDGIACFNAEGKCIYLNKMARIILRYQNPYQSSKVAAETYLQQRFSRYTKIIEGINSEDTIIINSKVHHFSCEYNNVYDGEKLAGSYIAFNDRTDEINHYKRDKYISTHDTLTGLLNRQAFFDTANKIIKENPKRRKCMLTSNIRDFKLINQIFGQEKGDEILIKHAALISQRCNFSCIIGRMGDDKFSIMMDYDDHDEEVMNASLQSLKQSEIYTAFKIRIVIGIRCFQGTELDAQTVYEQTMLAMDSISESDNTDFAYYNDSLMNKIVEEKEIISDFDKAISQKQIQIYLQPIFNAKHQVVGAEALSRWIHPVKGLIMPAHYLSILEKAGLIHLLDLYVWEAAIKKIGEWKKAGIDNLKIAVNVSPKDSFYIDIVNEFKKLLEKYDSDPTRIKIEFKETTITENFKKTMEVSEALQELGFQIEIDDFGIGYSSLNMLKDIEADTIKIDGEFINESDKEGRNATILQFIIQIAKVLGMNVVTQGVENEEKVQMLRSLGCNLFQGFFFSKPLSVEEFESRYVADKKD